MPLIKLSAEKLAIAQLLRQGGWTHERIAALLTVERTTITYALNKRKTRLPAAIDQPALKTIAAVMMRTQRAGLKAISAELKKCAAELDAQMAQPLTPL